MSSLQERSSIAAQMFDVAVVGAGTVGLALSIGLARSGFSVCLVGPTAPVRPGRTVALLGRSIEILSSLNLWPELLPLISPLRTMRIIDATGSLFRPLPVSFSSNEIGLPAFGYNIENEVLDATLEAAASRTSGLTVLRKRATGFTYSADAASVEVEGEPPIRARLVAAADGRHSLARKMARIGVRTEAHPQVALTALLGHDAPHQDVSTEFHTRQGPFTLVPLQDDASGRHRSSLVWVMSPAEAARRHTLEPTAFAYEAETQSVRLLGRIAVLSPIGKFPIVTSVTTRLSGPRLVLTGEAAHALPPIGAQGLNLSFGDIEALISYITQARDRGEDIGDPQSLAGFARARAGDIASRVAGVGLLNGSLLSHWFGADLARGAGLTALGTIGALRRVAMRRGLVPDGRLATLTRSGEIGH